MGNGAGGKNQPICDDPEGVQGIMAYRNECHFMKMAGDDGNAATAPDLVENENQSSAPPGFAQTWLSADQQSIPVLTPSSGTMYEKGAENQDAQGSPEGGPSNGPTPNSSGAGSDAKSHLPAGHMNGATTEAAFRPPLSPQQNMINPSHGMDSGNHQSYFGDSGFIPQSMPQQSNGFGMPAGGWTDMNGQPAGMPVGEGVLRALMNMGPMDAMDLSSWDNGADTHMRG